MATSREQLIEAAEKYLFHGLVEHDGSKVPLAPDCWRIEQGQDTGDSADNLLQSALGSRALAPCSRNSARSGGSRSAIARS